MQQLSLFPTLPAKTPRRTAKAYPTLAARGTIHYLDVPGDKVLSVSHLAGIGAVFYYRQKRIVCQAHEAAAFRDWQSIQFQKWVSSHQH